MKTLKLLCVFVVLCGCALADSMSFSNLNVTFGIQPNYGGGDNIGGRIWGTGVNLIAGGGTDPFWFSGTNGYLPGSSGGVGTTIFFDTNFGQLGSLTLGQDDFSLQTADFFGGSFTFPSNGQGFTVQLPAQLAVIHGVLNTPCPTETDCPVTFSLTTKPGVVKLSFYYNSYDGLYYPSSGSFTTVPEPGTLGLITLGAGAIWSRVKKNRSLQRREAAD